MKQLRSIAGMTFLLFIVGLFSGSFMLDLTKKILGRDIIGLSILTALTPQFSFGFLLAFCSISAGGVLWAYSKGHSKYDAKMIFSSSLLVSFISAAIGIGLKLLELRSILNTPTFGNKLDTAMLSTEAINYFSWGFGLVLFVNVILIAVLLWLSRQQQKDMIAPV